MPSPSGIPLAEVRPPLRHEERCQLFNARLAKGGVVQMTSEELAAAEIPFREGSFPFKANGRARALGQTDGLVKILAHAETDRVLGVHMIGPRVGELIVEAAMAIVGGTASNMGVTIEE